MFLYPSGTSVTHSRYPPQSRRADGALRSPLRLLAGEVPTVVNEFLDVIGIESQRASTRSHFHSRKIGLAFSRCMLNDPGDAHSQLLGDIARPHQLPNRPEFNGCRGSRPVYVDAIDSGDHTVVRTNACHDPYLRHGWDQGQKSQENECSGVDARTLIDATLFRIALQCRILPARNLCVEGSHSNT